MESLFWLAFEQKKYDYIISVIHHAANLQWHTTQDFLESDAHAQSANDICGGPEDVVLEQDLAQPIKVSCAEDRWPAAAKTTHTAAVAASICQSQPSPW